MTEDPRATAQRMYNAFNTRDFAAAHQIFAQDFYSHPLDASGPTAVIDSWARFDAAFPDVRIVVENIITESDCVAVRTSVHGIPDRQPPTMLEMFTVHDGRITELWGLSSLPRDR